MQTVTSGEVGILARFFPMGDEDGLRLDESQDEARVSRHRAIIVEANGPLARLIATGLKRDDISVQVHSSLEAGLSQLGTSAWDTLILDLDMPDVDGLKVLSDVRTARPDIRLMAVSRRSGTESLVAALDHGADDYLAKPFSLIEMMARVRALHRRSTGCRDQSSDRSTGAVVLNKEQCQVVRDGRVIDLTPREFTLLEYLMKNPGKTLSRALLTQEVWNMSAETNTNIVDVYIKYLRDKLDTNHSVKLIRTIRGMGYLFQTHA